MQLSWQPCSDGECWCDLNIAGQNGESPSTLTFTGDSLSLGATVLLGLAFWDNSSPHEAKDSKAKGVFAHPPTLAVQPARHSRPAQPGLACWE